MCAFKKKTIVTFTKTTISSLIILSQRRLQARVRKENALRLVLEETESERATLIPRYRLEKLQSYTVKYSDEPLWTAKIIQLLRSFYPLQRALRRARRTLKNEVARKVAAGHTQCYKHDSGKSIRVQYANEDELSLSNAQQHGDTDNLITVSSKHRNYRKFTSETRKMYNRKVHILKDTLAIFGSTLFFEEIALSIMLV